MSASDAGELPINLLGVAALSSAGGVWARVDSKCVVAGGS